MDLEDLLRLGPSVQSLDCMQEQGEYSSHDRIPIIIGLSAIQEAQTRKKKERQVGTLSAAQEAKTRRRDKGNAKQSFVDDHSFRAYVFTLSFDF